MENGDASNALQIKKSEPEGEQLNRSDLMNEQEFEISQLERVVEVAWAFESKIWSQWMKREIRRTENVCQGISRRIHQIIKDVYDVSVQYVYLKTPLNGCEGHKEKHIVVLAEGNAGKYIIDGTIQQYLPESKKCVFLVEEYPFIEEFKASGKVWEL